MCTLTSVGYFTNMVACGWMPACSRVCSALSSVATKRGYRVGGHELKVDHPPLDGYDEKAFVSETWLVSETPSSVTEN